MLETVNARGPSLDEFPAEPEVVASAVDCGGISAVVGCSWNFKIHEDSKMKDPPKNAAGANPKRRYWPNVTKLQ